MKYNWSKIKRKLLKQRAILDLKSNKIQRFYLVVLVTEKNNKGRKAIMLGGDGAEGQPLLTVVNENKRFIITALAERLKLAKKQLDHMALNKNIIKIEAPINIPQEYEDILEFYYE